jgi:hypothetical protein
MIEPKKKNIAFGSLHRGVLSSSDISFLSPGAKALNGLTTSP